MVSGGRFSLVICFRGTIIGGWLAAETLEDGVPRCLGVSRAVWSADIMLVFVTLLITEVKVEGVSWLRNDAPREEKSPFVGCNSM